MDQRESQMAISLLEILNELYSSKFMEFLRPVVVGDTSLGTYLVANEALRDYVEEFMQKRVPAEHHTEFLLILFCKYSYDVHRLIGERERESLRTLRSN